MTTIIIRDLDELVAQRLRLRARLEGVSIEEEARRILDEGTRRTRAKIAARAAETRASQKLHETDADDLIREDRDR